LCYVVRQLLLKTIKCDPCKQKLQYSTILVCIFLVQDSSIDLIGSTYHVKITYILYHSPYILTLSVFTHFTQTSLERKMYQTISTIPIASQ
jgi:hypothetical protein